MHGLAALAEIRSKASQVWMGSQKLGKAVVAVLVTGVSRTESTMMVVQGTSIE